MHRLFVAIRPPPGQRDLLLSLMSGIAGARWQNDDQLHLTLRFIGEVDRHQAQDIAAALHRVRFAPFAVALSGLGTFDRRGRIDTLWTGVADREPLARLHRKVDRACVAAGLPAEERAFLPHVTLARFARGDTVMVDNFLARHAALSAPPFEVRDFGLYESHMGHGGSAYHLVERYRTSE